MPRSEGPPAGHPRVGMPWRRAAVSDWVQAADPVTAAIPSLRRMGGVPDAS